MLFSLFLPFSLLNMYYSFDILVYTIYIYIDIYKSYLKSWRATENILSSFSPTNLQLQNIIIFSFILHKDLNNIYKFTEALKQALLNLIATGTLPTLFYVLASRSDPTHTCPLLHPLSPPPPQKKAISRDEYWANTQPGLGHSLTEPTQCSINPNTPTNGSGYIYLMRQWWQLGGRGGGVTVREISIGQGRIWLTQPAVFVVHIHVSLGINPGYSSSPQSQNSVVKYGVLQFAVKY